MLKHHPGYGRFQQLADARYQIIGGCHVFWPLLEIFVPSEISARLRPGQSSAPVFPRARLRARTHRAKRITRLLSRYIRAVFFPESAILQKPTEVSRSGDLSFFNAYNRLR